MSHLDFFRKQAKNFLKDWQTQTKTVGSDGSISYSYDWKFYDVGDLFFYYEFDDADEQDIMLARAQHVIAKMAGFKKWDDLIHATDTEQTLAELLLRRFKDAGDIHDWEEKLMFSGAAQYGAEAVLDYARQYYELGDAKKIVNFSADKIVILQGKPRSAALRQFDSEHNLSGSLRTDSVVFCTHCKKSFDFKKSKVIQDNNRHLTMVVCKNYPSCRGTYLDYKVLTPTILYGAARIAELERGIEVFPDLAMNKKVHCIHCGREYLYQEANTVIFPDDAEPYILCKHYPECDGSLIDMMPAEKAGEEK
ncbi:MAG: hypothetical protein NC041_03200 [Bacteroides sp.]|nr:hypothetical protein [Prevotella sp.]MCM1408131.1 hypothetical protein [Treponema brennaborense]MCM1469455.1 hypothetical protein [Bacteroides sp.]